jgi:epsilon-lactone hydrolase
MTYSVPAFRPLVLAACLIGVPAATAGGSPAASVSSANPGIVAFSANSPVPIDISPEAKALFLRLRPAPGQTPQFIPDCTDPAQRQAFLQFRQNALRSWDAVAGMITTPYSKVDGSLDGVNVTWLSTPRTTPGHKVILYIHGGAYIFGSAHANSTGMIPISDQTGIQVLAVDYRLAPESPFPAGLQDCKTVYCWLLRHGYRAQDIVILGESAGGGLALAAALSLRDEGTPLPSALVLLSPWTDLTRSGDTDYTLAPHSALCWETQLAAAVKAYVGTGNPRSPLLSPVYADLRGLPPMLIHAGTRDILLSDATRLNHRALKAGVEATLDVWEGMFHVHQHSGLPESEEALADVAAYIQKRLR